MKILFYCIIFYVSDNVLTRVHLANNILVHIIMLLFKSHPVYRQFKKLVKTYALINMVRHFPVLHFQVVHFQSPRGPKQPCVRVHIGVIYEWSVWVACSGDAVYRCRYSSKLFIQLIFLKLSRVTWLWQTSAKQLYRFSESAPENKWEAKHHISANFAQNGTL